MDLEPLEPDGQKPDEEESAGEPEPEPSNGLRTKLQWAGAVAGVAGVAVAVYFRNQIRDRMMKLFGKTTEKERQEEVIRGSAIEAPTEFLSAEALSTDSIIRDRAVGLEKKKSDAQMSYEDLYKSATLKTGKGMDTVHNPGGAEEQLLLDSMNKEIVTEANHKKGGR